MKEIKIGNLGRVLLISILKKAEGNILAINQVRELIPKVGFTEEDKERMKIVSNNNGSISWESNEIKEITLTKSVYDLVLKEIKSWNNMKSIQQETFDFIKEVLLPEDFNKILEDEEKKLESVNDDKN